MCALVFGILAGPVGLALGLIALKQIRLRGDDGRGMAIAGIVVGSVWTAVLGVAVLGALVGEPERDPSGEVTQGGRISVYELRVGDCFDGLEDRALVMSVEVRPCSQPHDGEVVDKFTMPDGPYPGDDEVIDTVEQECADRLSDKLATSPLYDRLQLYSFYPTSVSWKTGDRDALCAVADGDNVKLTEPVLPR